MVTIGRFDSFAKLLLCCGFTAVLDAAAGQNGLGNGFGAPATQGNGNQGEEEEAPAPEEPVSPLSCCPVTGCPLCHCSHPSVHQQLSCCKFQSLLYSSGQLVCYMLVNAAKAFASRPKWQLHDMCPCVHQRLQRRFVDVAGGVLCSKLLHTQQLCCLRQASRSNMMGSYSVL